MPTHVELPRRPSRPSTYTLTITRRKMEMRKTAAAATGQPHRKTRNAKKKCKTCRARVPVCGTWYVVSIKSTAEPLRARSNATRGTRSPLALKQRLPRSGDHPLQYPAIKTKYSRNLSLLATAAELPVSYNTAILLGSEGTNKAIV